MSDPRDGNTGTFAPAPGTPTDHQPNSSLPAVRHKTAKLVGCSFCSVIAVACIILGALAPTIVDSIVKTSIKKSVDFNPNTMSASRLAKVYSDYVYLDYYVYNLTNLPDVINTGARPLFQEVGPIKFTRYTNRYNISWSADLNQYEYNEVAYYELINPSDPLFNQTVVAIDAFFFGAQAQVLYQYNQASTGAPSYKVDFTYLEENVGTAGFFGSQVFPSVFPQYMSNSSTLVMGFRSSSIPFYVNFAYNVWQAQLSAVPWSQIMQGWGDAGATTTLDTYAASLFTGFPLPVALQSSGSKSAIGASIFNTTNAYGLATASGLGYWSKAAAGDATSAGLIMAHNGIDNPADLTTIGAWMTKLSQSSDASVVGAAYLKAICTFFSNVITGATPNGIPGHATGSWLFNTSGPLPSYVPSSWADVAALQFGTGFPVGLAVDQTSAFGFGHGATLAATGLVPITGATSFMNFMDNAATISDVEPAEFAQAIAYYLAKAGTTGLPHEYDQTLLYAVDGFGYKNVKNLNIAQAGFLLQVLESGSGATAWSLVCGSVGFPYFVGTWKAYVAQGAGFPAAAAAGGTAAITQILAYLQTKSALLWLVAKQLLTVDNVYPIIVYTSLYYGLELQGGKGNINGYGVAPQNTGIFATMKVSDVLFGYTNRFGAAVPGVIDGYLGPASGGKYSVSQLANLDWVAKQNGRLTTIQKTGYDNVDNTGLYVQYQGVPQYASYCDLYDPLGLTTKCTTQRTLYNWTIYGQPEVIAGVNDALVMKPLTDGDGNEVPTLPVFIPEAMRNLPISYTGNMVNIQGIDMRRYVVNREVLTNVTETNIWKNNYKYNQAGVPNGLVSVQRWKGGVPVYLSVPRWGPVGWLTDANFDFNSRCWTSATNSTPAPCPSTYSDDAHLTFIDIEPYTGITMSAAKKLQASVRISAIEYYFGQYAGYADGGAYANTAAAAMYRANGNFTFGTTSGMFNKMFDNGGETFYLPWYWANEHNVIGDSDASDARSGIKTIKDGRKAASALQIAGPVCGGFFAILSLGYIFSIARK